jgi:leucyl aminopeptidase (aminopeptidase T)
VPAICGNITAGGLLIMSALTDAFKSLFEINMGTLAGERIVVFSDTIRPDESPSAADTDRRIRLHDVAEEAAGYAAATYGNCRFVSFPATSASGAEPPEVLWRAVLGERATAALADCGILSRLLAKEASPEELELAREIVLGARVDSADVVVAMANNSTSHTRFRSLVNCTGGRFASLPHFDPEMFFSSMRVDWSSLAEKSRILADAINRAVTIDVTCPNGTSMSFGIRGRKAAADDGLLTSPGSFGNLPAGEVYLAPQEGTCTGTMVLEYAPTRKLAAPLRLTVSEGIVTKISGNDPHRLYLEQKFAENSANRNIAELGIGTNDRATRPDNILEAEKILGTIHIALGDNSGFGGTVSTPFHEDYVFYRPTLTAIAADGTEEILLGDGLPLFMAHGTSS